MEMHTTQSLLSIHGIARYPVRHEADWAGRGMAVIVRLWRAWRAREVVRRAARELLEMDDRMLADIGIDRSQIDDAVRNGRGRSGVVVHFRSRNVPHFQL